MYLSDSFVQESRLYEKLKDSKVKCNICNRRCLLPLGRLGFCKAMKNIDGALYTLEYGLASSISVNPVEKKPLFHFWPGSRLLTMGSWSCNFACPWCQNYDISKVSPDKRRDRSTILSPKEFVELATRKGCRGTSMSFSEPTTFFDFSIDVFKLAKKEALYNTVITNGYFTSEALDMYLEAGADAFGVGTSVSNAPTFNFAMDIVELEGKLSAKRGKLGGKKQVWRCSKCLTDTVLPFKSPPPECPRCKSKTEPMLKPLVRDGKIVGKLPKPGEIRKYVLKQVERLSLENSSY